uniref:(northern house mosquito) hypothetical protein n=1 Tax=Culex pipiens TaxID=7175 RepID=A0A8D8K179_CULPI
MPQEVHVPQILVRRRCTRHNICLHPLQSPFRSISLTHKRFQLILHLAGVFLLPLHQQLLADWRHFLLLRGTVSGFSVRHFFLRRSVLLLLLPSTLRRTRQGHTTMLHFHQMVLCPTPVVLNTRTNCLVRFPGSISTP